LANAGDPARSLVLRRAGSHIYLAGVTGGEGRSRIVLMRFHGNGRPDRSFGRVAAPISKPLRPRAIVPTGKGALVVLGGGPRPLLYFDRDGKVRRQWPGHDRQFIGNVRATVSRGRLIVGWNGYSYADEAKTSYGREVFYLANRPLGAAD
jgi:hypothetical protein